MRCVKLSAVVALAGAALAGCAANPIVARDPVPAPTGREVVRCDTVNSLDPSNWVERDLGIPPVELPDVDVRELDRRGFDFRQLHTDCARRSHQRRKVVVTKG